jgi:N-methylhydantoinase B/oxoprolinase/acetone carboxylase alpha subunit
MISRYGPEEVSEYAAELLAYTERLTRNLLRAIPDGTYTIEGFSTMTAWGTNSYPSGLPSPSKTKPPKWT